MVCVCGLGSDGVGGNGNGWHGIRYIVPTYTYNTPYVWMDEQHSKHSPSYIIYIHTPKYKYRYMYILIVLTEKSG